MYEMFQELYRMFHSGGNLLFFNFFHQKKTLKMLAETKNISTFALSKNKSIIQKLNIKHKNYGKQQHSTSKARYHCR